MRRREPYAEASNRSLKPQATAPPRPWTRRDFLRTCTLAAAAVGLPARAAGAIAAAVSEGRRPAVIWLSLQECTGCTESLLRTSHPALDELILDLISLEYHEALMAPSGHAAEASRRRAMEEHEGSYVLVTEGAVPMADGGVYCMIGGHTALEILEESAARAGAVVALGSCASWGGLSSSDPNPTGATGVPEVLAGRPVVAIPGCPPNPYNFLGTVLQFATFGTLPELDEQGRPRFAYARTIHDDCPRRGHFDAGRFAKRYGDEGHRAGWCLYELGCKGPLTHANCSTQGFCEVPGAWPVGVGHPCFGCTERGVGFTLPLHETADLIEVTPPSTYAPVTPPPPAIGPMAAGVVGAVVGAAAVGGWQAARALDRAEAAGEGPVGDRPAAAAGDAASAGEVAAAGKAPATATGDRLATAAGDAPDLESGEPGPRSDKEEG